jgi:hypothetical protein
MSDKQSIVDRWFRTESGEIVIAQFPNWPLIVWAAAVLLEKLVPTDPAILTQILSGLGFLALAYWSWLEITEGVNPFRKALGTVVLLVSVASRVMG